MLLEHPIALAIVAFVVLLAFRELGFQIGARSSAANREWQREQITASRDALSVLLSLLLGFTLAMTLPRYDLRKQLTIDESNSIGTTSLRGQLLPEPLRSNVRNLLREYVQARLDFAIAEARHLDLHPSAQKSKQLQSDLWWQAAIFAGEKQNAVTALFVSSLNETIDLSEKQLAGVENRIPVSIWIMLALISILTGITHGYAAVRRFWIIALVFPLTVAIVMWLIADLDSPRSGLIQTDISSLQRMQAEMR